MQLAHSSTSLRKLKDKLETTVLQILIQNIEHLEEFFFTLKMTYISYKTSMKNTKL